MINLFVTATDTDAGKTMVTCAIAKELMKKYRIATFKPISAGALNINGELINDDAFKLLNYNNCQQTLSQINPLVFEPPIAPHIAAANVGISLTVTDLCHSYDALTKLAADYNLIEGAGGWRLPLNNTEYLSDFVKRINASVILVVDLKLGCLNHAILTMETIVNDGLTCIGWVANGYREMSFQQENIDFLTSKFSCPLLGVVPKVANIDEISAYLDLTPIHSLAN